MISSSSVLLGENIIFVSKFDTGSRVKYYRITALLV